MENILTFIFGVITSPLSDELSEIKKKIDLNNTELNMIKNQMSELNETQICYNENPDDSSNKKMVIYIIGASIIIIACFYFGSDYTNSIGSAGNVVSDRISRLEASSSNHFDSSIKSVLDKTVSSERNVTAQIETLSEKVDTVYSRITQILQKQAEKEIPFKDFFGGKK